MLVFVLFFLETLKLITLVKVILASLTNKPQTGSWFKYGSHLFLTQNLKMVLLIAKGLLSM